MPQFLITGSIEQRTGMIQGSTCLQSQHSQLVGAACLSITHHQITQVGIINNDTILDGIAFLVDERKNLICGISLQLVGLIGIHHMIHQRYSTILAHQSQIEESPGPSSLPLKVLVTVHQLGIILIPFIARKGKIIKLIKEKIAISNTLEILGPKPTFGIGRSPSSIIEIFNLVA